MTVNIPNAFFQADFDQSGEKVIIKIRGELVDILLEIGPEIYSNYVIEKRSEGPLHPNVEALYGMMVSSLLYYWKFHKDIEIIGLEVNPEDMCVANPIINGKQDTITWNVADVKSSHEDSKFND